MPQQHLISLESYSRADIEELLVLAARIKAAPRPTALRLPD